MSQCIVIVQFDLPKRTPEQAVASGTASAPTYRGLAAKGLIRKDYLNGETGAGGVYLWESRAAAEAWYTDKLLASLTERFGVKPRLTWYDTHVTVDNLKGETRVDGIPLVEASSVAAE
ncbi:MAG: monooxygenase [Alphaproteobacteria bacterium]|nr:monooxygenase [Alphaproteobacteria bacterium]MCB9929088.1 monooxygenase [Alphaproteobacteria bacterium]